MLCNTNYDIKLSIYTFHDCVSRKWSWYVDNRSISTCSFYCICNCIKYRDTFNFRTTFTLCNNLFANCIVPLYETMSKTL